MERLIIRNFGPIESIDIEIKDINIFIGKTSSGKSTVAKLISIFNDIEFIQGSSISVFKKRLGDYNINFELKSSTFIQYINRKVSFELKGQQLKIENPLSEVLFRFEAVFSAYEYSMQEEPGLDVLSLLILAGVNPGIDLQDNASLENVAKIIKRLEEMRNEVVHRATADLYPIQTEFFDLLHQLAKELNVCNPLYIPAERILISMVAESIFGLLKYDVAIAKSIKDFGSKFEKARTGIKRAAIDFLGIEFEYEDNINFIRLPDGAGIHLENASSGYQSITPLYLVLEHSFNKDRLLKNCVVIEEPESNLYPTTQKDLIEYIIAGKLRSEDKLVITTHSPYVLTTIDNLIQAHNAGMKEGASAEEVEKIIPRGLWVDFDKTTCYYFENGFCRSTLDDELKSIGSSNIDDVSISLGKTFDELISLKYN